jgi:anti-sigma B factor antagonist
MISIEQKQGYSIARLSGRLDVQTSPVMESQLLQLLAAGCRRLAMNLEQVDYVSSTGLRMMIAVIKACRSRQAECCLVGVQPFVFNILQLGGFTDILPLFDTEEEVIKSWEENNPSVSL